MARKLSGEPLDPSESLSSSGSGRDRPAILAQTEAYMRETLAGDSSGHDPWHVLRVRRLALHVGRQEGADLYVVELAALLHDIADWKLHDGDEEAGPRRAMDWLAGLGVEREVVETVGAIVRGLSFKGAGVEPARLTLEGQVVQDADRLDALGAIGIGRTFAYGGFKGRALYDPDIPAVSHTSAEAYKRNRSPTLNHFPEKLLLLKERMNTAAARSLAERRHRYLEEFVERFLEEWEGQDLEEPVHRERSDVAGTWAEDPEVDPALGEEVRIDPDLGR